ncbi:MAG: hypothetical protein U0183_04695 [Polyangiaceae bacterium]
MKKTTIVSFVAAVTALTTLSCGKKDEKFESKVKLIRTYVNRRDEAGNPLVTDAEIQFTACPGDIRKVIRGGGPFAKCIAEKKAGEELSINMVHALKRGGRYTARVVNVGGCERTPDPTDSRSYDSFRSCTELKTDGILVGFHCDVGTTDELAKACPWFAQ